MKIRTDIRLVFQTHFQKKKKKVYQTHLATFYGRGKLNGTDVWIFTNQ